LLFGLRTCKIFSSAEVKDIVRFSETTNANRLKLTFHTGSRRLVQVCSPSLIVPTDNAYDWLTVDCFGRLGFVLDRRRNEIVSGDHKEIAK
jgi:hypothetical protein